ncbi:hypothetical protein LY78DRAFT_660311 [Colletotrichum sublineola]|nr:hypothetical protein LY78DRAFT_660311 [Colletotrichum sublineola]
MVRCSFAHDVGSYRVFFVDIRSGAMIATVCRGHISPPPPGVVRRLRARIGGDCAVAIKAASPRYTGPIPRLQALHGGEDNELLSMTSIHDIDMWTTVPGMRSAPIVFGNGPIQG